MTSEEILEVRLNELQSIKPTGDLIADLELQDEILALKYQLGMVNTCSLDNEECLSCGS
jgi:hypothetical protein